MKMCNGQNSNIWKLRLTVGCWEKTIANKIMLNIAIMSILNSEYPHHNLLVFHSMKQTSKVIKSHNIATMSGVMASGCIVFTMGGTR